MDIKRFKVHNRVIFISAHLIFYQFIANHLSAFFLAVQPIDHFKLLFKSTWIGIKRKSLENTWKSLFISSIYNEYIKIFNISTIHKDAISLFLNEKMIHWKSNESNKICQLISLSTKKYFLYFWYRMPGKFE